jgi:hypothetical protein
MLLTSFSQVNESCFTLSVSSCFLKSKSISIGGLLYCHFILGLGWHWGSPSRSWSAHTRIRSSLSCYATGHCEIVATLFSVDSSPWACLAWFLPLSVGAPRRFCLFHRRHRGRTRDSGRWICPKAILSFGLDPSAFVTIMCI